jgi:hypothetical protein
MKLYIVSAAILLSAGSALASETTIHNNSGVPIDELYFSAPGKKVWSTNLIEGAPEGSLDSGKSYKVSGLTDGVWDLRIEAPDEGVSCVMPKVEIKAGSKVELTDALGKACK